MVGRAAAVQEQRAGLACADVWQELLATVLVYGWTSCRTPVLQKHANHVVERKPPQGGVVTTLAWHDKLLGAVHGRRAEWTMSCCAASDRLSASPGVASEHVDVGTTACMPC